MTTGCREESDTRLISGVILDRVASLSRGVWPEELKLVNDILRSKIKFFRIFFRINFIAVRLGIKFFRVIASKDYFAKQYTSYIDSLKQDSSLYMAVFRSR